MKHLTITVTQDGEVLDDMVVSAEEWKREVKQRPTGLLAQLMPGDAALED